MRKHVKEIGKFFVFVAIFFALTSPFVVLFGPFDNLKRTVVGAILKSRHPQYITWLFSQEEIDKILGGISSTPKQELFKFKARTDSTLTLKNIDSSRFKGFLLEIPDPHRVQVATAENMDEKGDTTSGIAERVGAVAAINAGGFYDANGTGTGRQPYGFILHDGKYLLGQDASDEEENEFVGFTKDGNLITSRVGIYTANSNGLYDMAGNVAEWTSTIYTEAGVEAMNDLNPQLEYKAAKEDPYRLKKKSVRGGSWKDPESFIRSAWRTWEYQNQPRCYIGFRCVRSLANTSSGKVKAKGKKK